MKPHTDQRQGRLQGILHTEDFGTPAAELTGAAFRVLESRYLLRDAEGKICETPDALWHRVARAVASIEAKWCKTDKERHVTATARKFYELMSSLRFLPNSPTLMNAGKPKGQLSACFVLPIEDDLGKVFETLRDSAVIHKTGGGTGFNFGKLRPKGDLIRSSGGTASGPLAFLRIFDQTTNTVKQGGTRRGANMAILPVEHPDIESFITCKTAGGISNFNISVAVSDAFMKALKADAVWSLVNPRTGVTVKKIKARKLWGMIAQAAWQSGDPGVVFIDRINADNPTPAFGELESTNPCGEQPLLPYESCNLGSINLVPYLTDKGLDWASLEDDVELAIRFLDDIIEVNSYPLLATEEITLLNRKVGLGIMGWADALFHWRVPYDSEEALRLAEEVSSRMNALAVEASEKLAQERGPFSAFSKSIYGKNGSKPRRNATVTTIAPTGTISIIAGASSGIEPVFSLAYERRALEKDEMIFIHPELKKILREGNIRTRAVLQKILETGSVSSVEKLPKNVRAVFKTAAEIKPSWHVKMQAAFQKNTENAVSKTINLPSTATSSDIKQIYELAYEHGCKGITVFRDSSKHEQVLKSGLKKKEKKANDLLHAIDWLLDDSDKKVTSRKKASIGLASLSRQQLKRRLS